MMVDKLPLVMAVGAVLDFKIKHPDAMDEEIIQHVVSNVQGYGDSKVVGIAGANLALKYLGKNPKASKKDVMQFVMDKSDEIAGSVSAEEEYE
jgi:hypothetical protein